jgi:hypothetical protein
VTAVLPLAEVEFVGGAIAGLLEVEPAVVDATLRDEKLLVRRRLSPVEARLGLRTVLRDHRADILGCVAHVAHESQLPCGTDVQLDVAAVVQETR